MSIGSNNGLCLANAAWQGCIEESDSNVTAISDSSSCHDGCLSDGLQLALHGHDHRSHLWLIDLCILLLTIVVPFRVNLGPERILFDCENVCGQFEGRWAVQHLKCFGSARVSRVLQEEQTLDVQMFDQDSCHVCVSNQCYRAIK